MSILVRNRKLIKTEEEFIQYVLRKMGGLKFSIELCRDNWDDIIGDVIDDVADYGYGLCFRRVFVPVELERGVHEYNIDGQGVIDVVKIHTQGDNIFGSSHEGLAMYQSMMGGRTGRFLNMSQYNGTGNNLGNFADYVLNYSNYRTIQQYFKVILKPQYNMNTGILTLKSNPNCDMSGMLDCYVLDPIEALYNNKYFKRLAVAIAELQWVNNVEGKYKAKFAAGEVDFDKKREIYQQKYDDLIKEMVKESSVGLMRHTQ